jgi:hypothetical protein
VVAVDLAALQAALSEGKTKDLIFFAFDLLFDGEDDLRSLPLSKRKNRLKATLAKNGAPVIAVVQHFETGGDAVLRSACKLSLEGIVSKNSMHPTRPAAMVPGPKPSAAPDMRSCWSTTNGKFSPLGWAAHVGDDEADARIKLARMPLDFGDHPARLVPASSLLGYPANGSTLCTAADRREASCSIWRA